MIDLQLFAELDLEVLAEAELDLEVLAELTGLLSLPMPDCLLSMRVGLCPMRRMGFQVEDLRATQNLGGYAIRFDSQDFAAQL